MTKKQQCPCGNKDTEWSSTEADEIYCPKCGKHTVCGEWPTEPAKYFGYAEFERLQKIEWCVKQQGIDLTRKQPEPVSVSLEKCALAAQKDFPVVRTGADDKGNWCARPLDIEVFKRTAKAVLDAAGVKYVD